MDRRLDGVDGVVHSFIVWLGRAVHIKGAVQERGIVPAGEMAQFLNEGGALFLCNQVEDSTASTSNFSSGSSSSREPMK